jgi:glutamate:Na+ symporter, ESS family
MIELQPDGVLFLRSFLAVTTGIVVLFVGKALNRRFSVLREYNIPEPVTGGLLFATAFWLLYLASGYQVSFELTARDVLLVYFFTAIGINAHIGDLRAGGRPLVTLLASVAVFMLLQNGLGVAVSTIFGRPPEMGLLAGSVSLLGGHGTTIAWASTFAERGVDNALEIGILCATAGLVLGSVAGGPVARFLVERYRLQGVTGDAPEVGVHYGEAQPGIDYFSFLHSILAIHVCAVPGILVHQWLTSVGVKLPLFVRSSSCLRSS